MQMGMYVVLEIYISVEALNADLLGLGFFGSHIENLNDHCCDVFKNSC